MAKRVFSEEEVQTAIQASAIHCAWVLNHALSIRVTGKWTEQELIDDLKTHRFGTRRIHPTNQSFSAIGSAQSISLRLENLFQAIHGSPSHQWLIYWTNEAKKMDFAEWRKLLREQVAEAAVSRS